MSEAAEFRWPVRVYYENTDAGGVVYHSEYLKFFERTRTEWLRHMGFEQVAMREQMGVLFVVRRAEVHFLKPALFDDALTVSAHIARLGRSVLEFEQEIRRGEDILVTAHITVVCVGAATFKPVSLPETLRNQIQEFA